MFRHFLLDRAFQRAAASWVAVLLGPLCSGEALAQSRSLELDRNAEAVAEGRQGLAAFQRGDFEACGTSFRRAESISHSPVFVLYLARCLERRGNWLEARRLYDLVANEALDDLAPATWKTATIDAVRERTDLTARIPSVVVSVRNARAQELSVVLDGSSVRNERLATPWNLDPGEHLLVARRPDGVAAETRFVLAEGARLQAVELAFPPPRPQRAPDRGPTVASNENGALQTVGYVAAGLGVAGLLTGAIAGSMAWSRFSAIEARCRGDVCDPRDRESLSVVRSLATVSDVGFVVAAAGLSTGALFVWVLPGKPGRASQPSASGAVVGLRSTF